MSKFVLLTDSACDLSHELVNSLDIKVLPLTYLADGEEYIDYLGGGPAPVEVYEKLRGGTVIKTAAVNVDTFKSFAEPYLAAGSDILYIGFSSALSNTYNAGRLAAGELAEKYPERKFLAVDSKCASLGQGLLVYLCAKMKEEGADIEKVCSFAEENAGKVAHWFTVDDLHFLKRGGRISPTVAVIGTMLHVKPVLHVDDEGFLKNVSKVRGRQSAIKALCDKLCTTALNPSEQTVFISHGDCIEEAAQLAEMVKEKAGVKEVIVNHIGPVIGAHSGPGTIALFFLASER